MYYITRSVAILLIATNACKLLVMALPLEIEIPLVRVGTISLVSDCSTTDSCCERLYPVWRRKRIASKVFQVGRKSIEPEIASQKANMIDTSGLITFTCVDGRKRESVAALVPPEIYETEVLGLQCKANEYAEYVPIEEKVPTAAAKKRRSARCVPKPDHRGAGQQQTVVAESSAEVHPGTTVCLLTPEARQFFDEVNAWTANQGGVSGAQQHSVSLPERLSIWQVGSERSVISDHSSSLTFYGAVSTARYRICATGAAGSASMRLNMAMISA